MSSWEAGEWCRKGLARALCGVPWGLVSTAPTAGKLALAVVSLPLPPTTPSPDMGRAPSLEILGVCAWHCERAERWRVRSSLCGPWIQYQVDRDILKYSM